MYRTLVGHSERRHIVGESNALSAEKAILALQTGLGVVFCVGETLEEREAGKVWDLQPHPVRLTRCYTLGTRGGTTVLCRTLVIWLLIL